VEIESRVNLVVDKRVLKEKESIEQKEQKVEKKQVPEESKLNQSSPEKSSEAPKKSMDPMAQGKPSSENEKKPESPIKKVQVHEVQKVTEVQINLQKTPEKSSKEQPKKPEEQKGEKGKPNEKEVPKKKNFFKKLLSVFKREKKDEPSTKALTPQMEKMSSPLLSDCENILDEEKSLLKQENAKRKLSEHSHIHPTSASDLLSSENPEGSFKQIFEEEKEIEFSLCLNKIKKAKSIAEIELIFSQNVVSYEAFCRDSQKILSNKNLLVRIYDTIYRWKEACPIIMANLVFRKVFFIFDLLYFLLASSY